MTPIEALKRAVCSPDNNSKSPTSNSSTVNRSAPNPILNGLAISSHETKPHNGTVCARVRFYAAFISIYFQSHFTNIVNLNLFEMFSGAQNEKSLEIAKFELEELVFKMNTLKAKIEFLIFKSFPQHHSVNEYY